MTTKADFSKEEWTRLEPAPIVAAMASPPAIPQAAIEAAKESMATVKTGLEAARAARPARHAGAVARLGGM